MDPLTRELIGLGAWIVIAALLIAAITTPAWDRRALVRHSARALALFTGAAGIGWLLAIVGTLATGIHLCNYFGFAAASLVTGIVSSRGVGPKPYMLSRAVAVATLAILALPWALGVAG